MQTHLRDGNVHLPLVFKHYPEEHTSPREHTSMISLTSHSDSSFSSFKCAVPTCLSLLKKDLFKEIVLHRMGKGFQNVGEKTN